MASTMTPARIISGPDAHHDRGVASVLTAPTRKCATNETIAATTMPVVPVRQQRRKSFSPADRQVNVCHFSRVLA